MQDLNGNTSSPLAGAGNVEGLNSENIQQSLAGENNAQPENPISQNISPQINVDAILNLLKLVYQYAKKDSVNFSELEELVNIMEQQLEEK